MPLLLTATVWAIGAAPPLWAENDRLTGLTVMVGTGAVTVRVTGTVLGLFDVPEAVIVTLPLYVPAARPAGFTETLTLPVVLPLEGVADNHAAEVATE